MKINQKEQKKKAFGKPEPTSARPSMPRCPCSGGSGTRVAGSVRQSSLGGAAHALLLDRPVVAASTGRSPALLGSGKRKKRNGCCSCRVAEIRLAPSGSTRIWLTAAWRTSCSPDIQEKSMAAAATTWRVGEGRCHRCLDGGGGRRRRCSAFRRDCVSGREK